MKQVGLTFAGLTKVLAQYLRKLFKPPKIFQSPCHNVHQVNERKPSPSNSIGKAGFINISPSQTLKSWFEIRKKVEGLTIHTLVRFIPNPIASHASF